MRLKQLQFFLKVCEQGSITRAAAKLNIAQPALGLQIRSLEDEFGTALVSRGPRGVVPTPAGLMVANWARELLASEQSIKAAIREHEGTGSSRLSIGLSPSLTSIVAGRLMERIAGEASSDRVKIVEGLSHFLTEWVEEGAVDMALAFDCPKSQIVAANPVLRERLFYLSRAGSDDETIPLAEVLRLPLALPDPNSSIRQSIEQAAQSIGIPVRVAHEVSSQQASKEIAGRGIAGTVSPLAGLEDRGRRQYSARLIVDPFVERTLYLVRPTKTPLRTIERRATRMLYDELRRASGSHYSAAYQLLVPDPTVERGTGES